MHVYTSTVFPFFDNNVDFDFDLTSFLKYIFIFKYFKQM